MPTPTFPEPRLSEVGAAAPEPPPALPKTLAALRDGPIRSTDVAKLSDLNRADARLLTEAWSAMPEESRIAIVETMDRLAEERVELLFGRALRVAVEDDSPVVRQLAVAALWEDQGNDLAEHLVQLVADDPSQDVRAESARTLGSFAERAAGGEVDEGLAGRIRQTLIEVVADDAAPYVLRRRALEAVGSFGRAPTVRALIADAYDDEDEGIRASALYAMGRSHDPSWLSTVLDELQSPEGELRYEAARAAGAVGDEEAIPELANLTGDDDPEVRHAAVTALGVIGGRAAVHVLRSLLDNADEADEELISLALEEASESIDPHQGGAAS